MASVVGCSEDCVTDSDVQGGTFVSKKRPMLSYGSILGLKQIVMAIHIVLTHLSAIYVKLHWLKRILALGIYIAS